MMTKKKMIKFPKIGQFRNTIKNVEESCKVFEKNENGEYILKEIKPLPTLRFKGTVKLHGTNAGVTYDKNSKELYAQSRENVISIEKDNAGFAFFVESKKDVISNIISKVDSKDADYITVFGEWCGGNIQKNVAICELEKMFVIFGVKLSYDDEERGNVYLKDEDFKVYSSENDRIFNILDFKTFEKEIDFSNPKLIQNELVEITNEVENECPVGKHFGVKGIGEGIIWKFTHDDGSISQFKVKGDKHAGKSKVKKTQIVDTEKLNSINEFVDYALTEERLNQGIERVFTNNNEDLDIKKLSDLIKWVMNDILEEEMDTLLDNKLEPKDIGKSTANKCRNWFLEKWNKL
jgi:hypothetical protein